MIIVISYNILKIFIMYFSKIDQIYFIILLMNERDLLYIKIFRNTMLFHIDCHIFRVSSKKKFSAFCINADNFFSICEFSVVLSKSYLIRI